ncbi:MAG: hypothetical protein J3Q66DRAFT_372790 [Benniella sp.]|nr:MAG: hypothetical protein J3Q66DRAFT_372790 [Benniella sp.]
MFDLPELDDLIIRQLNRHDLAQCARVCRSWHRIVVPQLWSSLDIPHFRHEAFRNLVLESYVHEQRFQEREAERYGTEQHTQASVIPLLPLAKYGHWIRHLPWPDTLWTILKSPYALTPLQKGINGAYEELTVYDLMRHLYKHCPALQVPILHLISRNVAMEDYFKTIVEHLIPRVRRLHLYGKNRLESWKLMHLLYGASMLESLDLEVSVLYDGDEREQEEEQKETKPWKLKELRLLRCDDSSESKLFWSWLWKRCGQVEELRLEWAHQILQSLVEGIQMHMPKLDKLIMLECYLPDDDTAALLSSSHHGWKEISLCNPGANGGPATEALMQQCPVLEKLVVDRCDHFSSHDAVQVLASSPNLHTFLDVTERMFRTTRINATLFADRDLNSGSLRAWYCEGSLTTLRVRITGVPRPDLEKCQVQERYLGEGRGIQSQVYERLARLTRLESLWLGNTPCLVDQFDCLDMSLESGLYKLSGLKSLKELGLISMVLKIGVKEVQWMADSWPQLRAISIAWRGYNSSYEETMRWLQQNHPKIELKYM